jgi:hypothetical protein
MSGSHCTSSFFAMSLCAKAPAGSECCAAVRDWSSGGCMCDEDGKRLKAPLGPLGSAALMGAARICGQRLDMTC